MKKKVLVIDDDSHIRDVIRFALEQAGIEVTEAVNGREGLDMVAQVRPHLVILDIIMPEMDGLETCRQLRRQSDLPVLFLTSRDDEVDRIVGLEIGGDDYVTKPFSPRELVARVNVIFKWLERQNKKHSLLKKDFSDNERVTHGRVQINPENYETFWEKQAIVLTATEYNLLQTFLNHPQRVYTRDDLIQADVFRDVINDRTIDSHIRRLRSKFSAQGGENLIETVRGVGYRLGSCQ